MNSAGPGPSHTLGDQTDSAILPKGTPVVRADAGTGGEHRVRWGKVPFKTGPLYQSLDPGGNNDACTKHVFPALAREIKGYESDAWHAGQHGMYNKRHTGPGPCMANPGTSRKRNKQEKGRKPHD